MLPIFRSSGVEINSAAFATAGYASWIRAVVGHFRQRETGAENHVLLRIALHGAEFFNLRQPDDSLWRLLASFHIRIKVGTSGDKHGIRSPVGHHFDGLGKRLRLEIAKPWKS